MCVCDLFQPVQVISLLSLTLLSKNMIARVANVEDDAHIGNLLKAKFSAGRDFHTSLYLCSKEFDFIEPEVGDRDYHGNGRIPDVSLCVPPGNRFVLMEAWCVGILKYAVHSCNGFLQSKIFKSHMFTFIVMIEQ